MQFVVNLLHQESDTRSAIRVEVKSGNSKEKKPSNNRIAQKEILQGNYKKGETESKAESKTRQKVNGKTR